MNTERIYYLASNCSFFWVYPSRLWWKKAEIILTL